MLVSYFQAYRDIHRFLKIFDINELKGERYAETNHLCKRFCQSDFLRFRRQTYPVESMSSVDRVDHPGRTFFRSTVAWYSRRFHLLKRKNVPH